MNKKEERNWTIVLIIIVVASVGATKVLDDFYEMNGFISFLVGLGIAVILYVIYDLVRKIIKGNQNQDEN
ncbi:hypothetical protein FH966_08525 [Lentibacillus cibarius]|uniref:Uncharacterized protein n=1 Tax=Lentibacillus cibarius TaxID=2583219 RepID=A0A549YIL2_9BACI|nr:hypothetical protein [Lentibacillus cibarius]TRM11722.1 hypothetical protein FH966_08525 [Lentibacillus cibarius]